MLEQLVDFIKGHIGDVIRNNDEIPGDKKDEAIEAAGSSITEVVQQNAGNPAEISALQSGSDSAMGGKIIDTFSQKLSGLGLNPSIAASIVPSILAKFQNGQFNFQEMFDKLKGADGEFQLSDLKNIGEVLSGTEQAAPEQPAQEKANPTETPNDEGVIDKLKNLF